MNSIFPSTESLCNFFSYTILSCHDSVSIGVHWDSQETTEDALVCSAYVRELLFNIFPSEEHPLSESYTGQNS